MDRGLLSDSRIKKQLPWREESCNGVTRESLPFLQEAKERLFTSESMNGC